MKPEVINTNTVAGTCALPRRIDRREAAKLVVEQLPGGECVSARLLHHPYAGFVFRVEQRPVGRRLIGDVHVLVDLRGGFAATSDPWPALAPLQDGPLEGPAPVVTAEDAYRNARQCLVRTALHRRLSLRHPRIELRASVTPLYKPNWLLSVRLRGASTRVGILVDGLTGGYHTVVPSAR